jgi:hypothetical protein
VRLGRNKKGMGKGFLTTRGSLGGRESGGERGDGEDRRRRLEFEDGGGGSVGGVRDPADLNGSMGKPPMRRGREVRKLHRQRGSSGGGNGAAAGAPIGDTACEGKGGVEAWRCAKRVRKCPRGVYIGLGEKGKGLPVAMAINGHAALMGIQEGG